jgi:ribonuclease P protein component
VHALFFDASLASASPPTGGPSRAAELVRVGGPRVGLIVNKAVGSAVVRHRVSRRLRHVCARVFAELAAADFVSDATASDTPATAEPAVEPNARPAVDALLDHPLRDADLVIRALPGAAAASSAELTQQLRGGVAAALARRANR